MLLFLNRTTDMLKECMTVEDEYSRAHMIVCVCSTKGVSLARK